MRKSLYILFLVTTLALLATACGNEKADDKNKDKIKINTTVYPLQSFAEQIGANTYLLNLYIHQERIYMIMNRHKKILSIPINQIYLFTQGII